jgi:putative transposase
VHPTEERGRYYISDSLFCSKTGFGSWQLVDIEHLIVRIAIENPGWGYTRILGALRNLELKIGRGTIGRILKDHLIEPAPARGRRIPWSEFLKAHWKAIAASDFFTVEVWS